MLLEVQVDEGTLAADREIDPRTIDAAALQETYFLLPTRRQVHQEELFAVPPKGPGKLASPWLELPILHVATVGLQKVKDICEQGQSMYTLPSSGWRLRFEACGPDVLMHSEVNGRQGCVHYAELLAAFEHFASTAREVLSRKVPELLDHPHWGKWLTEKRSGIEGGKFLWKAIGKNSDNGMTVF
jgi:hypothetical protein